MQSDARNLATNLNTLFANLPRSANPNVELNGDSNPNATLSGSGTIEVDGETLNVNLSPDVVITKTGNANPTDGAGLKITHAGVEGWACVIPLPFSVAYAQTVTFQPTCGTVVSETGNLLTANQATGTDVLGTVDGFVPQAISMESSGEYVWQGSRSLKMEALTNLPRAVIGGSTNGSYGIVPVTPGTDYTFSAYVTAPSVSRNVQARIYWWSATNESLGVSQSDYVLTTDEWQLIEKSGMAPPGAAFVSIMVFGSSWTPGEVRYEDGYTFHAGVGGSWSPPGVPVVKGG